MINTLRGARIRRAALHTAAFVAALAPTLLPSPSAAAAADTVASHAHPLFIEGRVCFWTEPGRHGQSWCYSGTGYTDVPDFLHDKAASFLSESPHSVYAIDWPRSGGCVYRHIRPHDLSDNWSWGPRVDGVGDSTMNCQAG
ncbi:hypothetical protein AB0953_32775 [Streptomyces sp. NPDC046866]|uniref:hypothetical protein n=1 Tax=Streptomyces sp. NPDC046866 TaxID=3154921 RepID=UPI003453F48A